jgi:hypothetical protein
MLHMLDTGFFTMPDYAHFCQFVEYVRDQMGHPAHLRTTQRHSPAEETPAAFQAMLATLQLEVSQSLAELMPGIGH